MKKEDLRVLLSQPYQRENWQVILTTVFPNVQYLRRPQEIPVSSKKVRSFQQTGTVRLTDGKMLALFEVQVSEGVNIAENRVELRNLVARFIDQDKHHGVLAIYEQGKENFRFTFTSRNSQFDEKTGGFVSVSTDVRRYTYLLGKSESCRTAASRFWELQENKSTTTINDVEQAFSVERLNKEFFVRYKEHYERFVEYLTGKKFVKVKGKWQERETGKAHAIHKTVFKKDDRRARNFVKLLLGRLVFMQFLQKKGWLGVNSQSSDWTSGDRDFLRNYFLNCKNKERFYSDSLHPLFYEAFNRAGRKNEIFKLTNSRIPYLNGGLFEDEYPGSETINFPSEYFDSLTDFFTQYNFTINENDPDDHDVGIDPEMLGHIFENLLEDNNDKGTFYTPRPIVQFLCQESLKLYLKTYLKKKKTETAEDNDALHLFLQTKACTGFIREQVYHLATALKQVKACDPAIGSGAFPMGLLLEIFSCVQALHTAEPDTVNKVWGMKEWNAAYVKKQIIQNSIYGVDLEKGAIDIARLRFWLNLIVDEKEPYPLPNLDFKIMQGNSLIERFEDIDLRNISPGNKQVSPTLQFGPGEDIRKLADEYFNAQLPELKKKTRARIEALIREYIENVLTLTENRHKRNLTDIGLQLKANQVKKTDSKGLRARKEAGTSALEKQKTKEESNLKHLKAIRERLFETQGEPIRPYFLWNFYFADVFESGGFDIVIGNPPYVQLQKMGRDADALQLAGFETFERTGDLYCLFYEKGFDLLKENGVLSYITSNKWMRANYGESMRRYFAEKTNPVSLIDFGGYQVFDATVDTNILISQKSEYEKKTMTCVLGKGFGSLKYLSDYFRQNGQSLCFDATGSWTVLSPIEQRIKAKIEKVGIPLKNWNINIYRGVLTGYNQAFIIDKQKRDELVAASSKNADIIRPILRGRDIEKYKANWNETFLIVSHNGYVDEEGKQIEPINIDEYPAIKQHLDQYWHEISSRQDQGISPYNLRSCIYMDDFFRPKIIYPNMTKFLPFYYDTENYYTNQKCFIITGEKIAFLTAFFNSSLFKFCFKNNFPELQGGTRELSKIFFDKIPVKQVSAVENENFSKKVIQIQALKQANKDSSVLEKEIDEMIFNLYNLNEEEKTTIGFIQIA